MKNFIVTLFTNTHIENYGVKSNENTEQEAISCAMQYFRNKHGLFHLDGTGIGQMARATNGIPKNCILLDYIKEEDEFNDLKYRDFVETTKLAHNGDEKAIEYLKKRKALQSKNNKSQTEAEFPRMEMPN